MSHGPVIEIDDSRINNEDDVTEALNKETDEEENDELNNIDKIFKAIKSYGRYQFFFFITCQIMSISNGMSMIAGFFSLGNLIPEYTCHDEGYSWTLNSAVIKKNSTLACEMITNCTSITKVNHWYSMYEEYNWVCSNSHHLLATFQSLLPIGTFCGLMISGHLSDYFGRKWLLVAGELYGIISGFASALAPSFTVYSILRIIGSFIGSISGAASFSLIVESVNPKYRLIQGFSFQFSLGLMMAGIVGTLVRNWRTHLLISNIIGIPALLMMLKLEESPRFLLQKRRFKEAADVLTRIARFNGVKNMKFTPEQMKKIYTTEEKAKQKSHQSLDHVKKYTIKDLFANWKMTSYAISQILTGIAMNVVNGVLFFNIQDLSGNPFMNTFLMGALRLWTPFAAFAFENGTQVVGRKVLLVISQGTVFCFFFFMFIVDFFQLNESLRAIGSYGIIIGYTLESGLVWIAYKLYTTELFPTCIRSIALSTFSCTSLIGSVVTPQLIYMSRFWHPIPYSGAALVAGLSCIFAIIFLPETQFVALPDTVHQATNRKILYKETGSKISRINDDQEFGTNTSNDMNGSEDRKIILEHTK